MASLRNSIRNGDTSFNGVWEDTKDYVSVVITMQAPIDGSGTLQWSNPTRGKFPSDADIIASDSFYYSCSGAVTKEWDHRGRWFRLLYDHNGLASFSDISLNIETLYKTAADTQKITDGSAGVASVRGAVKSSYQIALSDISSGLIGTSNDKSYENTAIYTTLGDSSGLSLAYKYDNSVSTLFVALRDTCNNKITDTLTHDIYVHPSDAAGHSQASTINISGAKHPGVALYLAGADNGAVPHSWSTTRAPLDQLNANKLQENSVYVTLADSSGAKISAKNPLHVITSTSTVGINELQVEYGITENFFSFDDLSANSVDLYNLFTYNDGPTTVWTKLYDLSVGAIDPAFLINPDSYNLDFSGYNQFVRFNFATPAGQHRDFVLPKGAQFENGLFFRSTIQYNYDSKQGPGNDVLFINGVYSIRTYGGQILNKTTKPTVHNAPAVHSSVRGQRFGAHFIHDSTNDGAETLADSMLENTVVEDVPQDAVIEDVPVQENAVAEDVVVHQDAADVAQDTVTEDVPVQEDAVAEDTVAVQESAVDTVTEDVPVQENAVAEDVPQDAAVTEDVPQDATVEPLVSTELNVSGLPTVIEDPVEQSRKIHFNSSDHQIVGMVEYVYLPDDELLHLVILIDKAPAPAKEITLTYTDDSVHTNIDMQIGLSMFHIGEPLCTDDISVTQEELDTVALSMQFQDDKVINIPYKTHSS